MDPKLTYFRDSLLIMKPGDTSVVHNDWTHGTQITLDGYAIIPLTEYYRMSTVENLPRWQWVRAVVKHAIFGA